MREFDAISAAQPGPQGVPRSASARRQLRTSFAVLCGAFLVWIAWAAAAVPDVNEAHYFTKARQFWDAGWLRRDLFLSSRSAHWLFYCVLGWPTTWLDLDLAVWLGRIVGWGALAAGWQRLTQALQLRPWPAILAAIPFAVLSSTFNLSGEWVVGGIEAKVMAYAFVLQALAAGVQARWSAMWFWLGLATAWHPLVGGWSFVVSCGLRLRRLPQARGTAAESAWLVAAAMLAALGGVLPALLLDRGADPATRDLAHWIYVRVRLAHHLYIWDFPVWHAIRFAMLILLWRELARRRTPAQFEWLHGFAAGSLLLVGAGILLSSSWIPESTAASWLRYYWYRLADFAIPLAAALTLGNAVGGWTRIRSTATAGPLESASQRRRWVVPAPVCFAAVAIGIAALMVAARAVEHFRAPVSGSDRQSLPSYVDDPARTAATRRNWHRVCSWVRENTPREALCLTPRYQQTFKWLARRAEFANWKDVPQDAGHLVIWAERMAAAYGERWDENSPLWRGPDALATLAREHQIDYLIAEQREYDVYRAAGWLPGWECVYPSTPEQQTTYVVLKFSESTVP